MNRWTLGALSAVALLAAAATAWYAQRPDSPVIVREGEEAPDEGRVIELLEAGPHASGPVPEDLPNVVLVVGCTMRRDQTSAYDPTLDTTPFLAGLARDGVRFEDAVSAAPWTKAASTALLTGHHPSEIGMVERSDQANRKVLEPGVTTLAERMALAGYTTLGGTANPNLNAVFGFDQGFDRYAQSDRLWREGGRTFRGPFTPRVVDELLEGRPNPERPVFLQLTLIDAHAPYPKLRSAPSDGLSKRVHRYRAGLNNLDRSLAEVETTLAEHGLTPENTLWVVVNDHGEGLLHPEHHGKGHGRYLAPTSVGMVWLARGPGVPAGARVHGLASGVDLSATLLGLLDIDQDVPGIDHSDRIRTSGRTERERAWVSTWFADADRAGVYSDDWMCQIDLGNTGTGRFETGCFERATDPMHGTAVDNLALTNELFEWRQLQETRIREVSGTDAQPDEAVNEQLKALGYVD